ncbi:MAG: DEAD/DEAH box helicase [Dehalococcoidia bacterium]
MPLADLLETLRGDPELQGEFTTWHFQPPRSARFDEFPGAVDERLAAALQRRGIGRLYSHQSRCVEEVLAGRDVCVVTPTASGKTLCYNLPVLNTILAQPEARALYIFPTKALAQDQLDELHGLIGEVGADVKTFTYDGDTPADARRSVRAAGHVVITNPDMLHTGILPHHTKWVKLFENLRYVVIDELHQYRGVFGSHVANVIRRLRRVCAFYGADPIFICCSATIANPQELAAGLTGKEMVLVDDNGAPSGGKVIALFNPAVVNKELGIRRSALGAAREIAGRLIKSGAQTIVFAPSRIAVELLLTYLRGELKQVPGAAQRVEGYRGGYLPSERRSVEKRLRDGDLRAVVATNALELGIDIGSLEASVLAGYPGTLASTRQQFGRAGRKSDLSFAVLVAGSRALDQYIVKHPEYLLEEPPEAGLIDPDNLAVLASHVKCAAFELPFQVDEGYGSVGKELLGLLAEEGILNLSGGRYYWMAEAYPAEQVSLRTAQIDNFVIIETGPKARVIGEIDRPAAPVLVHDEAIYIHSGQQYHVDRLDWEEKKAYVTKVNVDYYTDANLAVDLKVLESFAELTEPAALHAHGEVAVTYLATIFKKIKLETHENVGWGKIHLPQEDLHTTSYWLGFAPETYSGFDQEALQEGLWGLAHLLCNVAPIFLMCDPRDLHGVAQVKSPFTDRPTLFLYEAIPGGVGFSSHIYTIREQLLRTALATIRECPCSFGCPGCVGPDFEGRVVSKAVARKLLERVA